MNKIITLYKWLIPRMFDTPIVSWSLEDHCCADWSELLEVKTFKIPDGYRVSKDLCGQLHFYGKYKGEIRETYFDVDTNQKTETK